ncbi:MAG TPA: nitroreductase family deazaflavin-dependent oxidoreductase [Acidimicrobiia bacterium]
MPLEGDYEPSPWQFVADSVRRYEATGGKEGNLLQGKPCVILTTRGRRTGKLRKTPLMRVEHDGEYAVVASLGGSPTHPVWFLNVLADPEVVLQDGGSVMELRARVATPDEKREWWPRAVAAWPDYANYQASTDRDIPVVFFDPR